MSNIILGSDGIAIRQGIYEESVSAKTDLGRFIDFQDGRRFRYSRAGSSATIPRGTMAVGAVTPAAHEDELQSGYGVAAGAKDNIEIGLTSAPDAKDDYAGGYLFVMDSTVGAIGQGYMYKIKRHDTNNAPCHLWLYDPVHVAILTTDEITLMKNKYDDLIVSPASAVVMPPVGVPLITVTAAYYFWAQTRGYCPMLAGAAAITIGNEVGPDVSTNVGGAEDVGGTATDPVWGIAVTTAADGEYAVVDLHLE